MDHIFGDSHDIPFGATKTPTQRKDPDAFEHVPQKGKGAHHPNPRTQFSGTPGHRHPPRPSSPSRKDEGVTLSEEPSLTRLIHGMKPSFLPREESIDVLRMVVFSDTTTSDPFMLFSSTDTTILVGTGFSVVERGGKSYPSFPDMRLAAHEKDKIQAWVLSDPSIDVTVFVHVLPALGFPPIYASREIIAQFRNTITNPEFLEKCRFFELFAQGSDERRIGDFVLSSLDEALVLRFRETRIALFGASDDALVFSRQGDVYTLAGMSVQAGEILNFQGKNHTKGTLKFTFDTFFVDKESIGVLAGYTLSDREQLAENGVLIFTLEEDIRLRAITGHIFIDSRGFVHAHEMMSVHKEILKGIRSTYEKTLLENPKIDRGSLVQVLRRELTKYCYLLTGRTPVVMPIIIER